MAARGTFQLAKPEGVEMTLTVTMSVKEWRALKARLRPQEADSDWYLDSTISDLIERANKEFHFYEEVTKSDPASD